MELFKAACTMLTFYQQLKADLHSLLMFETSCEAEAKILFIAPNKIPATCTAFNGTGFVAINVKTAMYLHKECSNNL
jgi:ribosomal protein S19